MQGDADDNLGARLSHLDRPPRGVDIAADLHDAGDAYACSNLE
jgi:hypothetical protein